MIESLKRAIVHFFIKDLELIKPQQLLKEIKLESQNINKINLLFIIVTYYKMIGSNDGLVVKWHLSLSVVICDVSFEILHQYC